jgi:hypothetical protein
MPKTTKEKQQNYRDLNEQVLRFFEDYTGLNRKLIRDQFKQFRKSTSYSDQQIREKMVEYQKILDNV